MEWQLRDEHDELDALLERAQQLVLELALALVPRLVQQLARWSLPLRSLRCRRWWWSRLQPWSRWWWWSLPNRSWWCSTRFRCSKNLRHRPLQGDR